MRRSLLPPLMTLVVILCLSSCATVYQNPGDRGQFTYRSSAVHLETVFAPEKFFLKLGRNVPGYQEPAAPSPEDLVVVEYNLSTKDMSSLENLLASLGKIHVAVFEGKAHSDGQEWPLYVRADVFDHSGKVTDPKTGEQVDEPQFTKTEFAFVEARSADTVFSRPGSLEAEAVFPFRLAETKDWGVYLTTLLTDLDEPAQRATARHGLWANLKLPEQQFEIRDAQGRVVAWFDNQNLSVANDPQVNRQAVKTLASAVLGFQQLARAFHKENEVRSTVVPPPPEEFPIVFPAKSAP